MALGCNIAVLVWFALEIIIIIVVLGAVLGTSTNSRSCYYSGSYSYC